MGHRCGRRSRSAGLTLIELMVALTIGLFLIAGTLAVFSKTRDLYRTNEANARLQETARLAMSVIETDLRMANFWGFSNRPDLIDDAAEPGEPTPASLGAGAAAAINQCGLNWGIDLLRYVEGSNNTYTLACGPGTDGTWATAPGSDSLTVRRASPGVIPQAQLANFSGAVKIQTSRVLSRVFSGAAIPAGFDPDSTRTHQLLVRSYYVAPRSNASPNVPSLRRKSLSFNGANTLVEDEEIVPGVEDLQVEYGIDLNDDQSADTYLTGNLVTATDAIVSARVWLLVRAENFEVGFSDDRVYAYSDRALPGAAALQAGQAYAPADRFRRVLISKTVQLRNTRR